MAAAAAQWRSEIVEFGEETRKTCRRWPKTEATRFGGLVVALKCVVNYVALLCNVVLVVFFVAGVVAVVGVVVVVVVVVVCCGCRGCCGCCGCGGGCCCCSLWCLTSCVFKVMFLLVAFWFEIFFFFIGVVVFVCSTVSKYCVFW